MERDRIICNCMGVTVGMIQDAIDAGAHTLEDIQEKTQASTVCFQCEQDFEAVVEALLNKK